MPHGNKKSRKKKKNSQLKVNPDADSSTTKEQGSLQALLFQPSETEESLLVERSSSLFSTLSSNHQRTEINAPYGEKLGLYDLQMPITILVDEYQQKWRSENNSPDSFWDTLVERFIGLARERNVQLLSGFPANVIKLRGLLKCGEGSETFIDGLVALSKVSYFDNKSTLYYQDVENKVIAHSYGFIDHRKLLFKSTATLWSTAFHEAGHAVTAALLLHDRLKFVTIMPRKLLRTDSADHDGDHFDHVEGFVHATPVADYRWSLEEITQRECIVFIAGYVAQCYSDPFSPVTPNFYQFYVQYQELSDKRLLNSDLDQVDKLLINYYKSNYRGNDFDPKRSMKAREGRARQYFQRTVSLVNKYMDAISRFARKLYKEGEIYDDEIYHELELSLLKESIESSELNGESKITSAIVKTKKELNVIAKGNLNPDLGVKRNVPHEPNYSELTRVKIEELRNQVSDNGGSLLGSRVEINDSEQLSDGINLTVTVWPTNGMWLRPCEGCGWEFIVLLPQKFPVEHPIVFCSTSNPIYHPNIDTLISTKSGKNEFTNIVYLPLVHERQWTQDKKLIDVVSALITILIEPNFHVQINEDACELYKDEDSFNELLQETTKAANPYDFMQFVINFYTEIGFKTKFKQLISLADAIFYSELEEVKGIPYVLSVVPNRQEVIQVAHPLYKNKYVDVFRVMIEVQAPEHSLWSGYPVFICAYYYFKRTDRFKPFYVTMNNYIFHPNFPLLGNNDDLAVPDSSKYLLSDMWPQHDVKFFVEKVMQLLLQPSYNNRDDTLFEPMAYLYHMAEENNDERIKNLFKESVQFQNMEHGFASKILQLVQSRKQEVLCNLSGAYDIVRDLKRLSKTEREVHIEDYKAVLEAKPKAESFRR